MQICVTPCATLHNPYTAAQNSNTDYRQARILFFLHHLLKTVFDFRLFLFASAPYVGRRPLGGGCFFWVAAGAMGAEKCHIIIMSTNETPTRDRLMFEAGRIINILKTLEVCPMFETSEKHPGKIRESAAGRMYRQYMSMLITVYKALDISGAPDSDISPLRAYLASRGKGGENGNT